jgi:hypothetical protein
MLVTPLQTNIAINQSSLFPQCINKPWRPVQLTDHHTFFSVVTFVLSSATSRSSSTLSEARAVLLVFNVCTSCSNVLSFIGIDCCICLLSINSCTPVGLRALHMLSVQYSLNVEHKSNEKFSRDFSKKTHEL